MREYVMYIIPIQSIHIYFFVKTIKCISNNKQVFYHWVLRNKIHEDNQVYKNKKEKLHVCSFVSCYH